MNSTFRQFVQPKRLNYCQSDFPDWPRKDFSVETRDGIQLECSILFDREPSVLLYLHSYNGCRLEALEYRIQGMALCCFDFRAAGKSGGDTVTFGAKEQYDVQAVLDYLESRFEDIVIWGRSMGATSGLLALLNRKNSKIKCMVLDSPFQSIKTMAQQLLQSKFFMPRCIAKGLFSLAENSLKELTQMNISQMSLPDIIHLNVPILVLGSRIDSITPIKEVERVFVAYQGPKQFIETNLTHGACRSRQLIDKIHGLISQISPALKLQSKQPIQIIGDIEEVNEQFSTTEGIKMRLIRPRVVSNSAVTLKNKLLSQFY